jgi:AraC-like DNA-binding protein
MIVEGSGRLNESRTFGVIEDAFAVRFSLETRSSLHAQHGAGIFVGLESDVTVTEPGRASACGRVVAVPPDVPHEAVSPGPTVGLLYDPEALPHIAGYSRQRGGAFPIEGRVAARLLEAVTAHRASLTRGDVLGGLAHESSTWLAQGTPYRAPDRRVARVIEALCDPTADRRLVVAHAGISPAHLQALFARDVGLPMRTFLLWHRLLAALVAFLHTDATSAAHLAGFADLAHFSRTCRKMLGYSPTVLRDGVR